MLGVHVAKNSKILDAPNKKRKNLLDAIKLDTKLLNLNTIQIFTYGPRNKKQNNIEYTSVKKYCKDNNIYIVVHSSYMTSSIWNITQQNKNSLISKQSIEHLSDQLISCTKIGAHGLVIHLPKKTPLSIVETLKILEPELIKINIPIILEIESCKPSDKTYETPNKLNNLCRLINEYNISNKIWSLCIDTAHLWASNIDIRTNINVDKWLNKFEYINKISLICNWIYGSVCAVFRVP